MSKHRLEDTIRADALPVAREILNIMRGDTATKFRTSSTAEFLVNLADYILEEADDIPQLQGATIQFPSLSELNVAQCGECCGTQVFYQLGDPTLEEARLVLLGFEFAMRQKRSYRLAMINHRMDTNYRQAADLCGWRVTEFNNNGGNNLFHAHKVISSGN